MGSSQSILSKEDLEAYKQLTYFTEAEIKNCLQRFSELLDPNIPLKSVHDPQANYSSCLFSKDMILQARILHEDVVNGLQELKVPCQQSVKKWMDIFHQQSKMRVNIKGTIAGESVCKTDLSRIFTESQPNDVLWGVPRHALIPQVPIFWFRDEIALLLVLVAMAGMVQLVTQLDVLSPLDLEICFDIFPRHLEDTEI